jgi:CheY-like chemotaxis protein
LLKLNLERTGTYEVRVENWGGAAAKAAREFNPQVVLLDVIMPQMFGGDVATQFKDDPELKHIPIVFLSASVKPQRVKEHDGVICGYPFIAKPASIDSVIEGIEKYALKESTGGPASPVTPVTPATPAAPTAS